MKTCLLSCLLVPLLGLAAGAARAQTTYNVPAGRSNTTLTTCNATIICSGPGGTYYPDQDAIVLLQPATPGGKVKVTFRASSLENGYDYLYIFQPTPGGGSTLVAYYTGVIPAGTTFTSTAADGSLMLEFISDSIIEAAGWTADVSCELPPARVGIGTSSPTQTLEVAGQIFSNAGGFRFPDNTVQTTAAAADNLGNHTAAQNLRLNGNWLSNDGGNEGLRITNAGNVGVGVAAPAARLDVAAGASGPALRLSSGAMVLSVASAVVSTAASTLTVTAAVHYYTDNAAGGANGTLTLGWTGIPEGQTLLLGNFDAQTLPVSHATGTASLPTNTIARFIFLNGGWRPM